MTQLLEKAFATASKLPDEEQDAIAAMLLAELASERKWSELFDKSKNVLEALGDEALEEHRSGKTRRLSSDKL